MDSIGNNSFNQTYNMDEGDVTTDQIRCTPLKKLTLKEREEPPVTVAGDVGQDSKTDGKVHQSKLDVLDSITRKREPSTSEMNSNVKIFKKMMFQLDASEQSEANLAFRSVLETLLNLAGGGKTGGRSILSGLSTAVAEPFVREGYTTLISSKQRLFTLCSMAVDTPLPEGTTELFISNLENSINESALVPILEKFGKLINLRIPIDAKTEKNRGFAFAIFSISGRS